MLKKLRLDQTKKYEQSIAVFEISKMLVAFVKGRSHYLCIGAEQGDIQKWDDLVIQDSEHSFIHIQVKRQTTDFSKKNDKCIRDCYSQRERAGVLRDLSPFDEAIRSLALWVKENNLSTNTIKRKFWIELPESSIKIKDALEIRHLRDLCKQVKEVTTATGLEQLASQEQSVKNCYDWLKSWCDFVDWDHILKALKVLTIRLSGLEEDIELRAEDTLKEIFPADKVRSVRLQIASFTDENTTYTGAIKPRRLLFELRDFLLPTVPGWTQFRRVGSSWQISGTHDLEQHDMIERSSIIVPMLWSNGRIKNLKISAQVNDNCKLSDSLIQLAIHQRGQVNTHCTNSIEWKSLIKQRVGNTLGVSKNDLNILNITDDTEEFYTSDVLPLHSRQEHENIAVELKDEMTAKTWELVIKDVEKELDEMEPTELRNAVESQWKIWQSQIGKTPNEQYLLFKRILHPNAEGEEIFGGLRIGVKTSSLIAEGLFLLLIVSVCLGDENSNWKRIKSHLSVNTIGLGWWSGPSGKTRKARPLDDKHIMDLIGRESSDILILSKLESSPNDIYEENIMSSNVQTKSLASPRYPKVLVTNNRKLKMLIQAGELQSLKKYLNNLLEQRNNSVEEAINQVVV
ncbi:ABC-three component system protein [uncultured Pontibacter sp.]|uniref:ABC-three component system protein n=1 Tax=uncultured Pontibacter sp. TaxID=453356 RepID=UPI00261CA8A5|nr:ABC-three component system protein [uncultured Pontibacter sp.]